MKKWWYFRKNQYYHYASLVSDRNVGLRRVRWFVQDGSTSFWASIVLISLQKSEKIAIYSKIILESIEIMREKWWSKGRRAESTAQKGIPRLWFRTIACRAVEWHSRFWISSESMYDEILWWPEARLENLQLQHVICREVLFAGFARPMDPVARSKPVICMARSLRVVWNAAERELSVYFMTSPSPFSLNPLSSGILVLKILKINPKKIKCRGWFRDWRMRSTSSNRVRDPKSAEKRWF